MNDHIYKNKRISNKKLYVSLYQKNPKIINCMKSLTTAVNHKL